MSHAFGSFIATRSSHRARRALIELARLDPTAPRWVALFGPPGTGKTHLLSEVCHRVRLARPASGIVRATGQDIVHALIAFIRGEAPDPRQTWSGAALVAIDDLHCLADLHVTQREVAELLKDLVVGGVRVVCAAGCSSKRVPDLVQGLDSLAAGVIIDTPRPTATDVQRVVALAAKRDGVAVTRRTLAAISQRSQGDVGRGLGALTRVRFVASWG